MKDRFAACFSAAVLAIGVYCLCSPYHCVIHAGYADEAVQIEDAAAPMSAADSGVFLHGRRHPAHRGYPGAARACVEALGNPEALVAGRAGICVDTGFTGDYETALMVYAASKDEYYRNTGYSMDHERLPGGDVRLLLVTEYVTPGQAYREHLEAKAKLTEIAASFHRTNTEKAEQIFQWACSHAAYADEATTDQIRKTESGCVPDYTGIYATTYTAVMDEATTYTGFSGMLLALFDMVGIPSARVQNSFYAYNAAFMDGRWVLYDAASGVSGDPESFIRRYREYYEPQTLTCGFTANLGGH